MIARIGHFCNCVRSDQEIRERFYGNNLLNATLPHDEGSIAKMIDHVLEKEFSENEQPEGSVFFFGCFVSLISSLTCFSILSHRLIIGYVIARAHSSTQLALRVHSTTRLNLMVYTSLIVNGDWRAYN